jgi:hypothetical protein
MSRLMGDKVIRVSEEQIPYTLFFLDLTVSERQIQWSVTYVLEIYSIDCLQFKRSKNSLLINKHTQDFSSRLPCLIIIFFTCESDKL